MMKWKVKKETTNIGALKLGNLTFDEDYMEVSIDIFEMSAGLKAEIDKAIEVKKVEDEKEWKDFYEKNSEAKRVERKWSDKPAVIDFHYLHIVLEAGKATKYTIEVGFHDAENEYMEAVASVTVDLSEYENELKKQIVQVLIEKFF